MSKTRRVCWFGWPVDCWVCVGVRFVGIGVIDIGSGIVGCWIGGAVGQAPRQTKVGTGVKLGLAFGVGVGVGFVIGPDAGSLA